MAKRPTWLKFWFFFGPVLLFGGTLFLLDGAWNVCRDYIQRTRWPAVNARIQACSIYESWDHAGTPNTKTTWSKSSYVRCKVAYRAGGSERESFVKVGDAISTYGNYRLFLTSNNLTIAKMQDWIARHPSRSSLAIHYDPANFQNLSLAGEDSDLKLATAYDRLWFGLFTCAGGFAILAIGRLSRTDPTKSPA